MEVRVSGLGFKVECSVAALNPREITCCEERVRKPAQAAAWPAVCLVPLLLVLRLQMQNPGCR